MKGVTDSVIGGSEGGRQQWGASARACGKTGKVFLFAAPLSSIPIHHRDCLTSVRSGGRPRLFRFSNWSSHYLLLLLEHLGVCIRWLMDSRLKVRDQGPLFNP